MNRQSREDFYGSENTWYEYYNDRYILLYIFSNPQTADCATPRVKAKGNYGLWEIMMCQCRFITCNNVPFWWEMLIMGEAMCVYWLGIYRKFLYLPFNFSVYLKLLWKKKVFSQKCGYTFYKQGLILQVIMQRHRIKKHLKVDLHSTS